MEGSERRRSARHLLGTTAQVHIGPRTSSALVHDVSPHGMGLMFPDDVEVQVGETLWILAHGLLDYAITATVRRITPERLVGVELDEVLSGEALETLEALPLSDQALIPTEDIRPVSPTNSEPQ